MNPADFFEDMHRRCESLLDELDCQAQREEWDAVELAYSRFRMSMRAHFEAEEEELFPQFDRSPHADQVSTALMREEHHRMNTMMDYMGTSIAIRDVSAYLGESLRLRTLQLRHGRREAIMLEAVFGANAPIW